MRRLLGLVLASLLATMLLALNAGQALANHVHCGDVITQDTTLYSDLLDCPGDGLVVAASHVTLDLNGHVIDGDGVPSPPGSQSSGVVIADRAAGDYSTQSDVDVRNGTVQEFDGGGVLIRDASAV